MNFYRLTEVEAVGHEEVFVIKFIESNPTSQSSKSYAPSKPLLIDADNAALLK